jgi:hypothetical protein
MIKNDNKKGEKMEKGVYCEKCDYYACSNYKWERHVLTDKHKMIKMIKKGAKKGAKGADLDQASFLCECGKKYKHQSNLCRHKKTCNYFISNADILKIQDTYSNNTNVSTNYNGVIELTDDISGTAFVTKNVLLNLLNQNKQLQDLIIKQSEEHKKQISELIPKLGNNNIFK